MVEEFSAEGLNVRNRAVTPDEFRPYAGCLSRLFLALMRGGDGALVSHKDARPEHVFILGRGREIEVRLIDWGRADVWPSDRFREWGARQLGWFYEGLSFGEAAIWKGFVAALADGFPRRPGRGATLTATS